MRSRLNALERAILPQQTEDVVAEMQLLLMELADSNDISVKRVTSKRFELIKAARTAGQL